MSKETAPEPGFQNALRTLQQARARRTALVLGVLLFGVGSVIGAYFLDRHTSRQAIRDALPSFEDALEDYLRCTLDTQTLPTAPAEALTALALKDRGVGRRFYRTCQELMWKAFVAPSLHLPEPRSRKRSWFSALMQDLFGTPPKDHYATFRRLIEHHHTRYLPSSEPHLMCRDFNLIHRTVQDLAIEYDAAFTLPPLTCLEHTTPPPAPSPPKINLASIIGTPQTLNGSDPYFSKGFWSRGELWLSLQVSQMDLPEEARHPSFTGGDYQLIFHTRPDELPRWESFSLTRAVPFINIEQDGALSWVVLGHPQALFVLEEGTWRQATSTPDERVFAFRQGTPGTWWLLTLDEGGRLQALRSTDRGRTFEKVGDTVQGPTRRSRNARSTFHLPDEGGFTTLIWDEDLDGGAFFALHLDASGTWHPFTDPHSGPGEGHFQACSDGPHFRALTPTGTLYASDDAGRSWRRLAQPDWHLEDPQLACLGPRLLLVGAISPQGARLKGVRPLFHALCDAVSCDKPQLTAHSATRWALTPVEGSARLLIDLHGEGTDAALLTFDPKRARVIPLVTFSHQTLTDDIAIIDGHIFASDVAQDTRRF